MMCSYCIQISGNTAPHHPSNDTVLKVLYVCEQVAKTIQQLTALTTARVWLLLFPHANPLLLTSKLWFTT